MRRCLSTLRELALGATFLARGARLVITTPRLFLLGLLPAMVSAALHALGLVVLDDCAFPLLAGLSGSSDPRVACRDAQRALLVGANPRGPGMEREDLLQDNARIFPEQGPALDEVAARDVQMRVVGNPANTNALIAMNTAKSLPRTSFTSMSLEIDAFSQERIALRANGSLTPRITR